jgi:RNA polymerase sigma factor (sigma-70 family)
MKDQGLPLEKERAPDRSTSTAQRDGLSRGKGKGMDSKIESLVEKAKQGDREALEQVVAGIQDMVYGLAIRMLSHPSDAEDATQEILIKVVTHLAEFRGESAFTSWVYRIASNHLLTTRKRRAERQEITFESCGRHVDEALACEKLRTSPEAEQGLFVEEMMILCTHAILLCLNRDLRVTYILGEILELTSEKTAYILGITPAAFRKRLSRARKQIRDVMQTTCGLVNTGNRCRCARLAPYFVEAGWINPEKLLFSVHPRHKEAIGPAAEAFEALDDGGRVAALFRAQPEYIAPLTLMENVRKILKSSRMALQGL